MLSYVRWRRPSWMEVWVTGYNFESWPFKDHSCHVSFKLAYWFQRKLFLNIFPIGSYVKIMSTYGGHLGWRSWSPDTILKVYHPRTIHAVCFKLADWFQRRRLLNIFSIGSYVKTESNHGSHLEFPISKRFTSLVQDHPTIISAKSQFNWLGGFWQEDLRKFSKWEHIMDPGIHVGFQISAKNTKLVEDHPMSISGKLG